MMRSMFSGVSGLRTHQTRMDIIGNNIANVNTVGFKSSRATFKEIFSQTLSGASAPDSNGARGGVNPMQVGLGIDLASVDTLTTRGSVQRTDYPYDVAIDGDGFFIVGSSSGKYFTRAGNFQLDENGNLVTAGGLYVYGWEDYDSVNGVYEFNTESELVPINFYNFADGRSKRIFEAAQTTIVSLGGNIDAGYSILTDLNKLNDPKNSSTGLKDTDDFFKLPVVCYDKLGNEYNMEIYFVKQSADANGSVWSYSIVPESGSYNIDVNDSGHIGTLTFNEFGKPVNASGDSPDPVTVTITPDASAGTGAFSFQLTFNGLTAFANNSSVKTTFSDGYKSGTLYNFSIGTDGIITGIYDNGMQKPLGMIALALFDNPAGLQKMGENLFMTTANSGNFQKAVKPGTGGAGALSPGTLEMSNVDLSKEFTEMIITQRGFQANSRIITTSDEMLQELVNLKR